MNPDPNFRQTVQDFLDTLPSCPPRTNQRGIVTCAGGDKYQANAYVVFQLLRQHGCTLPIECWYDGRTETDPIWERMVAPLGVRPVDACVLGFEGFPDGTAAKYLGKYHYPPAAVNGYTLKCFALAHTAFQEAMFLDADNCPAADPTFLFDTPAYQAAGHLFWPDCPDGNHGPVVTGFGLPDEKTPGFDSGQLLVDTVRSWPLLALVNSLQDRADYTYQFSWGDKDLFLVACRLLGLTTPLAPQGISALDHRAIIQPDLDGHPLFFHRAGESKLRPWGPNVPIHEFPWNAESVRYLAEWRNLKRLWNVSKSRQKLEADAFRGSKVVALENGVSACRVLGDTTILVHDRDQLIAPYLKKDGYWESFYTLACQRRIQPGWYCVDVGANYGYYAALFAKLVGRHGRVMALEPNPDVFALLEQTLRLNDLECPLEILPIAAAHEPGRMQFWHAPDNVNNASFFRHIAAHGSTAQDVPTDTLDRLLAPWHKVDLVKIDAEGAEEWIWDGMSETVARGARVMMEVQMSRYQDPAAFWRKIKQRFPLPCYVDYDGLVKPVPEYQLFEGDRHDWMLWLEP
jgi:FkbM family methyltransferase